MLGGYFSSKANKDSDTHFNPTELPDFVIEQYCKISYFKHYGKGFTISDPGNKEDYVTYDKYLRSINLQPPPVGEVFEAARANRLRAFFKEGVDPTRKLPIALKPDISAIEKRFAFGTEKKPRGRVKDLGYIHQNSDPSNFKPKGRVKNLKKEDFCHS